MLGLVDCERQVNGVDPARHRLVASARSPVEAPVEALQLVCARLRSAHSARSERLLVKREGARKLGGRCVS